MGGEGMGGYGGEGGGDYGMVGYGGMGASMGGPGGSSRNSGRTMTMYAFVLPQAELPSKVVIALKSPGRQQSDHVYGRLKTNLKQLKLKPIEQEEMLIVTEMIRSQLWLSEVRDEVKQQAPGVQPQLEESLRRVLTHEYQTGLARQEFQVKQIQARVKALSGEIARRRQAQQRVIDVKLGQIVLEAQGLLGK